MMRAVGSTPLVYLAWLVGGLLTLFGTLTYAELAAMMPYAGGEFVYLQRAYGDRIAFVYMWTWFAVAKPASIASVTTGLTRTIAALPHMRWLDTPVSHHSFGLVWSQVAAVAATWFVTGLNYIGVKRAGDFQLLFTVLKVLLVVGIAAVCLVSPVGSVTNFHTVYRAATGGFSGFMVALVAALWAYDGWNDLNMVAEEVKRPERNLPLALLSGVLLVGVLYIGVNAAIQFILPATTIAGSPQPAAAALTHVIGPSGTIIVTFGMALSILVTLNGTVMSGARVPFAAARDGIFFHKLAEIHPRFQSPAASLVVQGCLSTALLLLLGHFQQLFELAIFAEWLFYMITTSTIFRFRRDPSLIRPFRMWGYPVLPVLFILAAAVLLVFSFRSNVEASLIGSAIILCGLPLYQVFQRKEPARAGENP